MDILQLVIYGVVLGSILTLGAIGVSLVFGILRFAHFAHGDLMALGAFFALPLVAGYGWPIWAAAPVAMAGTALTGIVVDRMVYRRLRRMQPVILLDFLVRHGADSAQPDQIVWGPHQQVYKKGIQMPIRSATC